MLLKEDSITSRELGCWDLWRIANNVLNKGKFAVDLLFSGPEVLSSVSDKKKQQFYCRFLWMGLLPQG